MDSLENVLLAICAGLALAVMYMYYIKRVHGGLVKKLLDADALSEQSAVSIESLGYKHPSALMRSLREGSTLAKTVRTTPDGKLYVPQEEVETAERKYGGGSMTFFVMIILLLVMLLVALVSVYVFPQLLKGFEGLF